MMRTQKNIIRYLHLRRTFIAKIIAGLFVIIFAGATILPTFAAFNPGDTLDPGCLPTDSACVVNIPTATWGTITGALTDQADIQSALAGKISTTTFAASTTAFENASLSTTTAAATYLTQATAASSYLTQGNASSSYFSLASWFATTTDALAEGTTSLYYTDVRARNALSVNVTGLAYGTSTGVFSLTAGYSIPMTASTTNWNTAYNLVNAGSTNWDTAFGWGNHATAGYLGTTTAAALYLSTTTVATTYLSQSNASSTYLTQANASSSYLTQSNASTTFFSLVSWFATTTNALTEGSNNKYYTNNRVSDYLTSSSTLPALLNYWTKSASNLGYTAGNVGIGTTTPIDALSVVGNESLSGDIAVGGVASSLVPSMNDVFDLGSPSYYWRTAYVDTLNVNNFTAASTSISGTQSADFTLNSDNVSADAEAMHLIFYRGTVVPNAVIGWNNTGARFEFNQPTYIQNASTATTTVPTLVLQSVVGQTGDVFKIASSSFNTTFFNVTSSGNVGVGTTTPISRLSVVGDSLFTGNVGIGFSTTSNLLTIGTTSKIQLRDIMVGAVNGTEFYDPATAYVNVLVESTTTNSQAFNIQNQFDGSDATANVRGASVVVTDSGQSTNFSQSLSATGGTLKNIFEVQHKGTGTMLAMSGLTAGAYTATGAGTTTNAIGFYAENPLISSHVTNYTGVYIDGGSQTASRLDIRNGLVIAPLIGGKVTYGINQMGGNDQNYFAGPTGFGTSTASTSASIVTIQASSTLSSINLLNVLSTSGSPYLTIIKSSGNVGIGTSTPGVKLEVDASLVGYAAAVSNLNNADGSNGLQITAGENSFNTGADLITFKRPDGTTIGSVAQNAAGTVAYNLTSDQRLKENIVDTHYSLDNVLNIKVHDYSYISDSQHTQMTGFLAQELYQQYPEAVTVGSDQVDAQGRLTHPWQVDYSKLTPLLVKAIQDLNSKVMALASSTTIGSSTISQSGIFSGIGASVVDGITSFAQLIVGKLTVKSLTVQSDNLQTSGVTIYDRATGNPTCMYVENGVVRTSPGSCDPIPQTVPVISNSTDENISDQHTGTTSIESASSTSDALASTTAQNQASSTPVDVNTDPSGISIPPEAPVVPEVPAADTTEITPQTDSTPVSDPAPVVQSVTDSSSTQ